MLEGEEKGGTELGRTEERLDEGRRRREHDLALRPSRVWEPPSSRSWWEGTRLRSTRGGPVARDSSSAGRGRAQPSSELHLELSSFLPSLLPPLSLLPVLTLLLVFAPQWRRNRRLPGVCRWSVSVLVERSSGGEASLFVPTSLALPFLSLSPPSTLSLPPPLAPSDLFELRSTSTVAFKVYDMDRDGFISNGELFLVLKMMVGSNLKVSSSSLPCLLKVDFEADHSSRFRSVGSTTAADRG